MGTTLEGEWDEVMGVVTRCFEEMNKDCDRVYMTVNVDYRKGKSGRIESKVRSVESKLTAFVKKVPVSVPFRQLGVKPVKRKITNWQQSFRLSLPSAFPLKGPSE